MKKKLEIYLKLPQNTTANLETRRHILHISTTKKTINFLPLDELAINVCKETPISSNSFQNDP